VIEKFFFFLQELKKLYEFQNSRDTSIYKHRFQKACLDVKSLTSNMR